MDRQRHSNHYLTGGIMPAPIYTLPVNGTAPNQFTTKVENEASVQAVVNYLYSLTGEGAEEAALAAAAAAAAAAASAASVNAVAVTAAAVVSQSFAATTPGNWAPLSLLGINAAGLGLNNYGALISHIDTSLAAAITAGTVVKTDRGAASDAQRIFSYRIGSGPIVAVIDSAIHGNERVSIWAMWALFRALVAGDQVAAQGILAHYTIHWIPCLNPYGYIIARTNANAVDLNRNFSHYWAQWPLTEGNADSSRFKGPSAMSEPETTVLKDMIDALRPNFYMNIHNTGDDFLVQPAEWTPAAAWTLSDKSQDFVSQRRFAAKYGIGATRFGNIVAGGPFPFVVNWAQRYLKFNLGLQDAYAIMVEFNRNVGLGVGVEGSNNNVSNVQMTAAGGAIATILETYIQHRKVPLNYGASFYASRNNPDADTGIASGGSMINVTTMTPLQWDTVHGYAAQTPPLPDKLRVVVTGPGILSINASFYLESAGAAQRIDGQLFVNGVAQGSSFISVTTPAGSPVGDLRVAGSVSQRNEYSTPPDAIIDIQLRFTKAGVDQGVTGNAKIIRCRLSADYTPRDGFAQPFVKAPLT
jgi:hypothetical protein